MINMAMKLIKFTEPKVKTISYYHDKEGIHIIYTVDHIIYGSYDLIVVNIQNKAYE
jgi:hypothetical protein